MIPNKDIVQLKMSISLKLSLQRVVYPFNLKYSFEVVEEFSFKPSAFKHGIAEPDIRNAFEKRMVDYAMPGEEHKNLLLGLARDGSLLEVIYNVLEDDIINVFHAMKCRKSYYVLLRTGRTND